MEERANNSHRKHKKAATTNTRPPDSQHKNTKHTARPPKNPGKTKTKTKHKHKSKNARKQSDLKQILIRHSRERNYINTSKRDFIPRFSSFSDGRLPQKTVTCNCGTPELKYLNRSLAISHYQIKIQVQ